MKELKNYIFIALTAVFILGFACSELIMGNNEYSLSERRTLAAMPEISASALASGRFMTDFESFSLDQAPARDALRHIKALCSGYIFSQRDNHGIFSYDGYVSALNYPANYGKTDVTLSKLGRIYSTYLQDSDCKVYLSIIPDKNYFLSDYTDIPVIDYDEYIGYVREKLGFAEYIDIFDGLCLEYYYRTDQHWDQQHIEHIAETLCESMGHELTASFYSETVDVPFYGAYVGQAALNFEADTLSCLVSPSFDGCTVTSYNSGTAKPAQIYDMEKAHGRDPYEMFLGGADALITIENPNAASDGRLIIFRDSFASSLAPLMVDAYREITLVDLRYIQPELLSRFIDFEDQDVLFLYSTLVLNSGV